MKSKIYSTDIIWPTEKPNIVTNFLGTGLDLLKEEFGALSQNSNNPLSRVCVANSAFSLEPVRGCPLGCSYCIVGGDLRNFGIDREQLVGNNIKFHNIRSLYPRTPTVVFPGKVLANALIGHPSFIKHKSVISISTGSSEAFIPISERETWGIMQTFAQNGLKNPFWIVTKRGIPDDLLDIWLKRFNILMNKGIQIIISITSSNAPYWVEPYRQNRFKNFDKIKKTGVHISQHLRPVIRGINDSRKSLEESLNDSLGLVESICVGGLRKDPSVLLAWKFAKGLDPNLLPDVKNGRRRKDLPNQTIQIARSIVKSRGYSTPIFSRSSHVISYALGISDYNLYRYRVSDDKIFLTIPRKMREVILLRHRKDIISILKEISSSIKLDINYVLSGDKILIKNHMNYQEHRALIHAIGHSGVLSKV